MLQLKDFGEMKDNEIQEYVREIKKEFDGLDYENHKMVAKIKRLLDKNIVMGPLDVLIYNVTGTNDPISYYYISKQLLKVTKQYKKLELLENNWEVYLDVLNM